MFLEDTQIDLPYSCHAMTRSWLVHGFADQGARLYVGDTLASPSTLFQIDHHADHTHPESGARVGNLAHCAFSSAISGNARIFGGNPLIWNYQYSLGTWQREVETDSALVPCARLLSTWTEISQQNLNHFR